MPPLEAHNDLDEDQIEILGRWIEQGAAYAPHWAYVPPAPTPVPEVADDSWPRADIDRYILARLEAEDLAPAPDADRATLLRRLTLDLTGLPPTVEDLDAFLAIDTPDAIDEVVDRLLASPAFAERMAMLWLDLVRYADTVGYHGDQEHRASLYRDWVIWAFDEDMPFDEFTIAQIAGDLVETPTDETRIASCYNRLIQTSHEGGVQMKEYAAIYAADRVSNLSEVWMGATMGCAQCHDHKYDPYTAHDFYAMAAFFADIDDLEHLKNGGNAPNSTPTNRFPEVDLLSPLDRERRAVLQALLDEASEDEAPAIRARLDAITPRRVMVTRAAEPRVTRLLPRGNWLDESGPVVNAAIPAFLGDLSLDRRASRLDLARWLVDAEHGAGLLTARVMVNRLWAMLHGEGLCPSLDDFGGQGQPPTHLELLDALAIDFASDWDVKRLVRTLVTTRTYGLSSVASPEMRRRDPLNHLFARQTTRRVQAETVRDIALHLGGLLVDHLGGESVKPYQPRGYYQHLNFPPREYEPHLDERQWRRGVYVHWQRQFVHPTFKAFDAPTRESCIAKRATSNTPLAALA
ncbi:MAG: DUF1549 domain-containing protein, partial [Phycisphaerales bacterium]|nr:DUF1549 domain-containing protein [Phycisphaerales bacterium]